MLHQIFSRHGKTEEEKRIVRKIKDYVLNLEDEELLQPIPRENIEEELELENPIVVDIVQVWLQARRNRLLFDMNADKQINRVKLEIAKLHMERE